MAYAALLLHLAGLLWWEVAHTSISPHRKAVYLTVDIGADLTLRCPHEHQIYKYYWYKQSLGELPRLVSNIYLGANSGVLENEFKTDARFTLGIGEGENHLSISDVRPSDSATYFCTTSSSMNFDFAQSVTVFARGGEATVRQASLRDVEPGRPVVLTCSVRPGSCGDRHAVHWFKRPGDAEAGVLYSHGGRSGDQCGKSPEGSENSCVYSLPISNVSSEQTGTYYCAVAACGQVLFGNGTRLSVKAPETVYILTVALTLTTSLLMGVLFRTCFSNSAESHKRHPASSTKGLPKVVQYMAAEDVTEVRRRMDETWSECIYFSVYE